MSRRLKVRGPGYDGLMTHHKGHDRDEETPWGTEPGEHPLESDEADPDRVASGSLREREPTGQVGSASEQYGGAGTTPDEAPELEGDVDQSRP